MGVSETEVDLEEVGGPNDDQRYVESSTVWGSGLVWFVLLSCPFPYC